MLIYDILHKISFYETFLICLLEDEYEKEIEQVYEIQSGGHFNGKDIFHKLLRLGYY